MKKKAKKIIVYMGALIVLGMVIVCIHISKLININTGLSCCMFTKLL